MVAGVNGNLGLVSSKGANFNNLKSLLAQSKNRTATAEAANARAKAIQDQQAAAGGSANAAGQGQKSSAQDMQIAGQATSGTGQALVQFGNALIMASNDPMTAWSMKAVGMGFVVAGSAAILTGSSLAAAGAIEMADGNAKVADGQALLAESVANGDRAAREAGVVSEEITRSAFLEQEINVIEATQEEAAAEKGGDLSEDEKEAIAGGVRKGFEKGAETLKNGGIATIDGSNGEDDRYFKRLDNGDLIEVDVARKENGEAEYGDFGELQEAGEIGNVDPNSQEALQLFSIFTFTDKLKDMIKGGGDNPALTRLEFKDNGGVNQRDIDLNNLNDLNEFAAVINAAHEDPPPLRYLEIDNKFIQDNPAAAGLEGELAFIDNWNWDTNSPDGEVTSDNIILLKDVADDDSDAYSRAGFDVGARANLLGGIVDNAIAGDAPDLDQYSNRLRAASQSAQSRSGSQRDNSGTSFIDSNNQNNQNNQNANGLGAA